MPIKRLQLFRNGEGSRPAAQLAFNSNRTRDVEQLREECAKLLGMKVTSIYSADGDRIRSIDQLSQESILVCSEREAFRKEPYGQESKDKLTVKDTRRTVSPRGKGRRQSADSQSPSRQASAQSLRPFTSYLDMNKSSYGIGTSRYKEWENKFEAKHIFLVLSGEPDLAPKPYCYRNRVTKTWAALLIDIKSVLKPLDGGDVQMLFSQKRRKEATKLKHLQQGETYIVCGEVFYEEEDEKKNRRKSSRRSRRGGSSRRSGRSLSARRDDGLKAMHERPDQTNPENKLFHAFLNGDGYQVNPCGFNQKQLERGMPWVIERVSAPYGVNGQKLTTMGGIEIEHTEDLINRGAYVLIPHTQKFKAAWYILKDGMVDTTNLPADEQNNNRNRLTANAQAKSADSHRSNSRSRNNSARSSNRSNSKQRGNPSGRSSDSSTSPTTRRKQQALRRKDSSDSSPDNRARYNSNNRRPPSTADTYRRPTTVSSNGSSRNTRRNVRSSDSRNSSPPQRRRSNHATIGGSSYRQQTMARSNYRTTTGYSDDRDNRQSTPDNRR